MKRLAAMVLSTMLPLAAGAQDFPADRIVSAAIGDWDGDDRADLALIARPPDESDDDHGVYIYLNKPGNGRLTLVSAVPDKVWGSLALYGQQPEISALPNGSISIVSGNDSVGRNRWEQSLTVAYRNFDFVVAGYTYSAYDTLDPEFAAECDLNVLTGKGKAGDRAVAVTGAMIALRDWSDDIGRKACGIDE